MKLEKLDDQLEDLFGTKLSSGAPPQPLTLKIAIIHIISRGSSADPVASMAVPHKLLHAGEEGKDFVNLTTQEADLIRKQTVNDQSFTDLIKAIILKAVTKPTGKGKGKDGKSEEGP